MKTFRLLHLEDDRKDAMLARAILEAADIPLTTHWVETRHDFEHALDCGEVDLILSDSTLPGFDGMRALEIARVKRPDVPFILLSGTLGEELAIDSLRNGATDYVLKERMSRLVPAVRRAMQEIESRAERSELQEQFVQAQKMEVVGQLAGGVAHDFNNIISVIMGYSDMLLQCMSPVDGMREPMQEIFNASQRAAALTRQLLIFSRKQTLQPVVLDMGEVIAKTGTMLRQLINEDIELSILPGDGVGHVKADPGYMSQVLMNLVVNARDAIAECGKITIESRNVSMESPAFRNGVEIPAGHYVLLTVADTGTGMSDEVKAHIFEPFFTTKPKDRGTGLGLATCQTIVEQTGGRITVESEIGKGTTFSVYLPRVDEPIMTPGQIVHAGAPPRGTETLLVVEDQPAVRDLACNVLRGQGYHVLHASNGQEGLRVASAHHGAPIRLVITDVIMPEMNGKVMVEWLQTGDPDLPVLFTSGYTDDAISQHGVLDAAVNFLGKPYTPSLLIHKVREILDAA